MNTIVSEHLFEHYTFLLGQARRYSKGDEAYAEDLVQITFEKALRASDTYDEQGNLRGWLTIILRNTFYNDYRAQVRHGIPYSVEEDSALVDARAYVYTGYDLQISDPYLVSAIKSLPEYCKAAVYLVVGLGYSTAEASAELGVAQATILTKVHRGKKLLAEAYKQAYKEGEGA
jgi:RNA polymerase sigma-70 factor (ECF subfamily)